jgi:hypothetical protein
MKLKKLNPKIAGIIMMIISILLAGGITVQETTGPGVDPGPTGGSGGA